MWQQPGNIPNSGILVLCVQVIGGILLQIGAVPFTLSLPKADRSVNPLRRSCFDWAQHERLNPHFHASWYLF
jgi:hypothetical protein